MHKLYLIRHAYAGKRLQDEIMDDARPLKKRGKETMRGLAKSLDRWHISFDMVFTSPLVRAEQSAVILNAACGKTPEVKSTDLLKPQASYQKLMKFLNQMHLYESVALVGHEPFLSGFASFCLSNSKNSFINLKKGGILLLEVEKKIKPQRCKLAWLMEPELIIR